MERFKRLTALILSTSMILIVSITALATGDEGAADTYTYYKHKQTTSLEKYVIDETAILSWSKNNFQPTAGS